MPVCPTPACHPASASPLCPSQAEGTEAGTAGGLSGAAARPVPEPPLPVAPPEAASSAAPPVTEGKHSGHFSPSEASLNLRPPRETGRFAQSGLDMSPFSFQSGAATQASPPRPCLLHLQVPSCPPRGTEKVPMSPRYPRHRVPLRSGPGTVVPTLLLAPTHPRGTETRTAWEGTGEKQPTLGEPP